MDEIAIKFFEALSSGSESYLDFYNDDSIIWTAGDNAIGGTRAIVPSEGIVFKYKGKTYKFTGAFAPVNQITGLMSF